MSAKLLMRCEDRFSKRPKDRLVNHHQRQSRGNKTNYVMPLNMALSNDEADVAPMC